MGKQWKQWETLFCGAPESLQMVIAATKLKDAPWKESCDKSLLLFSHSVKSDSVTPRTTAGQASPSFTISRSLLKLRFIELLVPSNHLILYCLLLLLPQSWTILTNQCILKEINSEYSLEGLKLKSNSLSPDVRSQLPGKDPDAGKDWGQEEKETTEDELVGWHHWLSGHEFEETPGDGEGQGSVACCSPWGHRASDTT